MDSLLGAVMDKLTNGLRAPKFPTAGNCSELDQAAAVVLLPSRRAGHTGAFPCWSA